MAPSTLSSVDRTGSAIVLMQGSYDSRGKKVNEVRTYDVFGSHRYQEVYSEDGSCNGTLQHSLNEFLLMWLNNLYEQGHKIE